MTKGQKKELINFLTDEFKSSNAVVIANYKGLTVPQIEALRKVAKISSVKVKVIKNTLADIAFKNAGMEGLKLVDTNIVIWGEDLLNVCKVVTKYAETNNDKFIIKKGYMENAVANTAKIEALSKMPSRDELIGMLLSTWMAPITNFTVGLDALRKKKEEIA